MISVAVDNRKAWLTESEPLTSGSLGQTVEFEFSDDWDGLGKYAVFVAYDRTVAVALLEDSVGIPKSVLTLSGIHLFVGVYGCNEGGTVVIPTKYCDLGMIYPGANPEVADNYTNPTADMLAQMYALTNAAQFAASIAAGSALTEGVEFSIKDHKTLIASAERDGQTIENELGPVTAYAASLEERPNETYDQFCARLAAVATYSATIDALNTRVSALEGAGFQRIPLIITNNYMPAGSTQKIILNDNIEENSLVFIKYPDYNPVSKSVWDEYDRVGLYCLEVSDGSLDIRCVNAPTFEVPFTVILFPLDQIITVVPPIVNSED